LLHPDTILFWEIVGPDVVRAHKGADHGSHDGVDSVPFTSLLMKSSTAGQAGGGGH